MMDLAFGAGGLVVVLLLYRRPDVLVATTAFLLIGGSTKFRTRDADAMLRGDIDSQIVFEVGVSALVGAIAFIALLRIGRAARFGPLEWLLAGYLLLALGSAFWSPNFEIAVVRALQLAVMAAAGLALVRYYGADRAWVIFAGSLIAYLLIISAAGMLMSQAIVPNRVARSVVRLSFFAMHPLVVGTFAACAALLLLSDLLFSAKAAWMRFLGIPLWVTTPLFVYMLVTARARGAILGFVAALTFMLVRRYLFGAGVRRTLIAAAMACVLAAGVFAAGASMVLLPNAGPVGEYFLRGSTMEGLTSLNGRVEILQIVASMALDRPLFGYGYLASRSVMLDRLSWAGHAHNGVAESILNLGLVGTIFLWLAFGAALFGAAIRCFRSTGTELRTLVMICATGLFLLFNSVISPSFAGAPGFEFQLYVMMVIGWQAVRSNAGDLSRASHRPGITLTRPWHSGRAALPGGLRA